MLRDTPQFYNTPIAPTNLVNATATSQSYNTPILYVNLVNATETCSLTILQTCHDHRPWSYHSSTNPSILILSRTHIPLYPNQLLGSCFKPQSLNKTRTCREALTPPSTWILPHTRDTSPLKCNETKISIIVQSLRPSILHHMDSTAAFKSPTYDGFPIHVTTF